MKYLIIGNGVAGTTAASTIRKLDDSGQITIVTDEAYPYYSRIRLMEFLSGEVEQNDLVIKKDAWYEENRIELILNTVVSDIDINNKQVVTSSGNTMKFDRLLIATGGISFVPPIPGSDKKGVFTLRTLEDACSIRDYAKKSHRRVLLIGGGVLGLEAGNGLRRAGNAITVAEFFPRLLPRQMDPDGADILKAQMEKMGFRFYLGAKSREITGADSADALILEDNTRIDCDMIIISAGVRPNLELAKKLGLKIEKGVLVNDRMETGLPDIYAAGDLVQHNGVFYGIWPAAEKQGEIAGVSMAGGNASYNGTTMSNRLKVVGIDLISAGEIDAEGKKEAIVLKDDQNFIYKKLVLENNMLVGAIFYGDIKDSRKALKAIENKINISTFKKDLENWNLDRL